MGWAQIIKMNSCRDKTLYLALFMNAYSAKKYDQLHKVDLRKGRDVYFKESPPHPSSPMGDKIKLDIKKQVSFTSFDT